MKVNMVALKGAQIDILPNYLFVKKDNELKANLMNAST